MDAKITKMMKLIEADGDTFARRAEMYFEKRPELMKLVEEYHRGYRALAERCHWEAGVNKHKDSLLKDMDATVKEMMNLIAEEEDSFARRAEMYFRKRPELIRLVEAFYRAFRALVERCDREAVGNEHKEEYLEKIAYLEDMVAHAQEGRIKAETEIARIESEKKSNLDRITNLERKISVAEERAYTAEQEVEKLKKVVAELKEEKEEEYVQSLLEKEAAAFQCVVLKGAVSHAREDGESFNEWAVKAKKEIAKLKKQISVAEVRAIKAESELGKLEEVVAELKEERKSEYEQSILVLKEFNERVLKAEVEAQNSKGKILEIKSETMYNLEEIPKLEKKISAAEERANKAEIEVEKLKKANNELKEERKSEYEQSILVLKEFNERVLKSEVEAQYSKRKFFEIKSETMYNLEQISKLEKKISSAEERANKAETEVEHLKKANDELKEERKSEYEHSILVLKEFNERVLKSEVEAQYSKSKILEIKSETMYNLEQISKLKKKISAAEERANKAETEVEKLKKVNDELKEEREVEYEKFLLEREAAVFQNIVLENSVSEANARNAKVVDELKTLKDLIHSLSVPEIEQEGGESLAPQSETRLPSEEHHTNILPDMNKLREKEFKEEPTTSSYKNLVKIWKRKILHQSSFINKLRNPKCWGN